jgi:hypothetical protein
MKTLRDRIPFAIAGAVFLILLTAIAWTSLLSNAGHLTYALDDPYIHMAIAKNLVTHGVFGVTQFSFSSSTSSPLWTLMLALAYRAVGASDWTPGILAALFALAALYSTDSLGRLLGVGVTGRSILCVAVVYFTPLVPIVSTGMEHAMHLFLAIVLVGATIRFAMEPSARSLACACGVGMLAVATRYESLFLIGPLAVWLLCAKQIRGALLLGISAFLPVLAYGVVSMMNGSYFLPNSLMLKGHFASFDGIGAIMDAFGGRGVGILIGTGHLYVICVTLLLGAFLWRRDSVLPAVALCMAASIVVHLQFALTGWFYRYEAYLVAASLPIVGGLYCGLRESLLPRFRDRTRVPGFIALMGCILLLAWPLHLRAMESLDRVAFSSNHIYRQQYQMAEFLRTMYAPGVRVACNDLGAVSYYADADILDLWGLGTIEVTRAKRAEKYDASAIEELLKQRRTEIVMVYSDWFNSNWPKGLIPVAKWTLTNNYWGKTVSFYALSQEGAKDMAGRLRQYQVRLPDSVAVSYQRPQ